MIAIPVITLLRNPTVAIVRLLAKCQSADGFFSFAKTQSMLWVILVVAKRCRHTDAKRRFGVSYTYIRVAVSVHPCTMCITWPVL